MKRLLILTLATIILVVLAAVAAAAPPDFCNPASPDYKPDHPQCSSTTTTTTPPSDVQACTPEVLTGIAGSGATRFECLWTPAPPDAETVTTGTVRVTPDGGAISRLAVVVRDASPGDICVLKQEWNDQDFVAEFDLEYSGLDVEEFPDYAPYEGETYWSFGGTNWCYPQDPISGMRPDPNGEPLHLQVNFRVHKGTTVNIVLAPGQDTTTTP